MRSVFFISVLMIHLFEILHTQLYDIDGLHDLAFIDNKWWSKSYGIVMSGFG